MTNRISKNSITISRETVRKKGGIVILSLGEYERLKRAIPTYQLKGKAAEKLDKLVEEGLREHREGKTELMEDFLKREYPKLYGKYSKN